MSQPEQPELFSLPPQPTDEEIRHEVSSAIQAAVELHPIVIEEKTPSEATVDQGHAGPQLIPGTPIATVMKRAEASEYYQNEFGLSGVAEQTPEALEVRQAGFAQVREALAKAKEDKLKADALAEAAKQRQQAAAIGSPLVRAAIASAPKLAPNPKNR